MFLNVHVIPPLGAAHVCSKTEFKGSFSQLLPLA